MNEIDTCHVIVSLLTMPPKPTDMVKMLEIMQIKIYKRVSKLKQHDGLPYM